VFVDVVAVLVVAVAVVEVIYVVFVLDCLAAVVVGVGAGVLGVHLGFLVLLAAVEMVHVVLVLNGVAPVAGQVLVVQFVRVRVHHNSFARRNFSLLLGPQQPQDRPQRSLNDTRPVLDTPAQVLRARMWNQLPTWVWRR
jgi:uncharacterized membrane protein required for colicin V production